MCTFEEKSCLFDDDLALKERWMITASTVRKWDNTLDIGVFAFIVFTADCKNKPRTVPDLQILCVRGPLQCKYGTFSCIFRYLLLVSYTK